jgi:hypothetical protein
MAMTRIAQVPFPSAAKKKRGLRQNESLVPQRRSIAHALIINGCFPCLT